MTQQFTANEVVTKLRERFASDNDVPVPDVRLTRAEFDAFADMLEAQEKAVPVAYAEFADNGCVRMWSRGYEERSPGTRMVPLYTHPASADAEKRDTMTPHELAKRIERGEKWKLADEPTPCQSRDAERLAEALRVFDGSFLKELADLVSFPEDDRGCINRSFVMERVVGLRRCWDKLSATRRPLRPSTTASRERDGCDGGACSRLPA